jgi:hypothetical protein
MIPGIHNEVLMAAGYVLFLSAAAFLLEALARFSHRRSENYRNAGFSYQQKMNQWECPMGLPLLYSHTDHVKRIAYYKASAHDCNACSLKLNCTDSDEGRVLESRIDLWVESELRRFHRGISISLLVLGTIILLAEMTRHSGVRELGVIVGLLVPVGIAEMRLLTSLLSRDFNPGPSHS